MQQTELVNFGGAPLWSTTTNPIFDKATVDHYINRAYAQVLKDFADTEIGLYTATFLSTTETLAYALPPAVTSGNPNPPVHLISRLFYTPQGLGYTLEFEPGLRMVPWKTFQRYTASGYLNQYSYGTQPEICSITPDFTQVQFYPGTATAGDTIELQYSPIPTVGSLVPPLTAETDSPIILKDDVQDMITIWALWKLWPKAREMEASKEAMLMYYDQVKKLTAQYIRKSRGDQMRITDATLDLATSGPFGWF